MKTRHHLTFVILTAIVILMSGCLPSPYYQKSETIPRYNWDYSHKPTFRFDITDTTANYQSYLIIRHTQAYPFSNIWMLIYVKSPGDTIVRKERVNVVLAETSGKWLGRGMDEIWEQHMLLKLSDSIHFNKPGTYEMAFEQNMRVNPLPEIMTIGLRVEKTGKRVPNLN